jgi:HD-GYP domain-containing protein (c-di-GMP phosphodiesterase class II)
VQESPHRQLTPEQLEEVVLAFADYSDLKSPYIAGHSRRVATLAESMALRMAFRPEEVGDIRRAALAHDIGLVAVPSFVLDRPEDRLTEAEREQLRLHPYHSRQILSRVASLAGAAAIAATHHEQADGAGYPAGLAGIQISPQAGVLAVADCFDELTHAGPDREALDTEGALDLLQSRSSRFSQAAVNALAAELGLSRATDVQHPAWPRGLTDREVEVLRLVARGNDRREVARQLFLSEGTVRSHLEHIYGKIGVSNRASATLFAVENGLLS